MSELPAHRSHRAAASSSSHSPSKLPSALHLPSIDSWSSLYDRLPPLSFSPMRESSPPLSPHSVGERRSYAYIRGSSPRLSPGGYHYPSDVNYCAYQDPYLGGKFALPGIRTVFGEDNYDHHRHHHGIPSEFDASESSEDAESSPQSDPLDRLHQPTTSTSTSMFDSEEEQEEDDEEGLSFRETGLRATFFRTSAERGQWRADPILPYQQSLLLQMRKSEPVPSPTATTIENSLGGIQRRISEPALITSKDTFLPADPSDGHESEVSCDPQLSSVGSALAGGCISAALGSSDKGRYPSSAAESSPIVDTRPALPPSSPLPALTPEMSPDVLPESESEATEPPASSEPSEEISEPSDVLEEGEKMVDEVIADAVMEAGVEVEMSAEDLAMETRAVSPLPPSSPFPPSSPMLEVVSSIPVSPALVPDPQLEENDLERELQIAPQPEENDILPEIVPAPQPEENDYEVEPVLEQDLQAGETDLESETRALSPAPSLRSLSPLSFAPSSPVAPSSPLSIISSVDDDDFASYEGSSSAGELPSVSPIDVVKTWVEDSASSIRPAGSKKNEVKAQASSSVVPVVVKEKPKPKRKLGQRRGL
ncbi:hypothetical protein BDQ17DRAFT_945193 [Cyathus striatus]|nr:hypothetical protein BDQ17DRAFT_945193 [Cyathus striatus]